MEEEQLDLEQEEPARELREQAETIRRMIRQRDMNVEPSRMADWKKATYLVLIVSAIFGSVYLLVFENQRRALVAFAARGIDLDRPAQEEIFKLGAPPPKAAEPEVRVQGPAIFSDDELDGVLYADIELEEEGGERDRDRGDTDPEFIRPARTEGTQKAFEFLSQTSDLVQQLVDGRLEGYTFKEWNPLQNDPPVFLLDLTALKAENEQELHLIFEVNLQDETVRPLSQAARDLVR